MNLVLRKAGAFYLRRKFAGDKLYTAVFGAYVAHLVAHCPALEFYIEGTRSRTGKFVHPRTGLLSIVARGFFEGRTDPGRSPDGTPDADPNWMIGLLCKGKWRIFTSHRSL